MVSFIPLAPLRYPKRSRKVVLRERFLWGTFEKVPNAPQNFYRLFYSTLFGRNVHPLSIGGALRFGKSVYAVQTLHDFSLLCADGRIAPAIILGPTSRCGSVTLAF